MARTQDEREILCAQFFLSAAVGWLVGSVLILFYALNFEKARR